MGCVWEEWGIVVENATEYTVSEVLLAEDVGCSRVYHLRFSEPLRPGEVREYFAVDYAEFRFVGLRGATGSGEAVETGMRELDEALRVEFPCMARLVLRLPG